MAVGLYPAVHNCPKLCTYVQLFLVPYSLLLCCSRRCLSWCKHSGRGVQVPAHFSLEKLRQWTASVAWIQRSVRTTAYPELWTQTSRILLSLYACESWGTRMVVGDWILTHLQKHQMSHALLSLANAIPPQKHVKRENCCCTWKSNWRICTSSLFHEMHFIFQYMETAVSPWTVSLIYSLSLPSTGKVRGSRHRSHSSNAP